MTDLPFYMQINLRLLLCSGGILFFICCLPISDYKRVMLGGEPAFPVPSTTDKLLTLFFVAFTTLLYTGECFAAPSAPESDEQTINLVKILFTLLLPIILYLPLIVRYFFISYPPAKIQLRNVLITFAALASIYILIIILHASGIINWLVELTGTPETQQAIKALQEASLIDFVVLAITAIIIAPIVEEIVFRGFFFRVLSSHAGVIVAALISSVLFGAVHLSLAQTITLTVFGLVQCTLYASTRSIIYPMLLHMLFNCVGVVSVFVNR